LRGPGFDVQPPPGGYAWWYVDALSDDGRHALTIIAFVGSVFSPYYAAARRRAPADPRDHVAFNVALYGDRAHRWTMTERGRDQLTASADALRIGPSALGWDGDTLVITLREMASPLPRRVAGRVRVEGLLPGLQPIELDAAGCHRWQPVMPRARVSVDLDAPALRWTGEGYVDSNQGDVPLETSFASWQWCRTPRPDGGTFIRYDVRESEGGTRALRLDIAPDGSVQFGGPRPSHPLKPSRWGIARAAHDGAELRRTLEDGPFYARSLFATPWQGRSLPTLHESLSLDRFRARWVQALLPFRMPRRAGDSR
jgi:carotenoid 1,2-hydratase